MVGISIFHNNNRINDNNILLIFLHDKYNTHVYIIHLFSYSTEYITIFKHLFFVVPGENYNKIIY